MTAGLVAAVTVAYAATAVLFALKGNQPMAIVYLGYSIANIGLIFADLKG